MELTLLAHPQIARRWSSCSARASTPTGRPRAAQSDSGAEIDAAIDAVASLDEDRILRSFLVVVRAMLRTNYFQPAADGRPAPCRSSSTRRSCRSLPRPRPQFEIFVYSPRVEGVHLRGGPVARGGLRWSDRREDFRTEILGLMKAQMVKNALIVPVGAKGGFVVKRPPAGRPRGADGRGRRLLPTFISGLLDVTDNIVDGKVVPPRGVVRHDERRPVPRRRRRQGHGDVLGHRQRDRGATTASGSATRSPRAARVGYDHKAMGITARGAWESVKRHFRELGIDVAAEDFTVVGIGDMSGDVFGNGMLLSPHIRLLAAFNHRARLPRSRLRTRRQLVAERQRLFELPRSSWADYDVSLISEGGGVFPRTAKSIPLSAEVRAALDVDADRLTPNELIQAILRAPVDLLWNGGIGTYVKAAAETHADVGDKANDAVRVDASDLRCAGRRRGRQPRLHPARRGSSTRSAAGASTPTRSTMPAASTAPTTRSTSRSCSTRWSPTAT